LTDVGVGIYKYTGIVYNNSKFYLNKIPYWQAKRWNVPSWWVKR